MKSIIFHLSDLHVSKDINDTIVDYFVQNHNFSLYSKALFVFSGDLAYSGKESQYMCFYAFLEKIRQKVESNGCEFIFIPVPGNHDINYDVLGVSKNDSDSEYLEKYEKIKDEQYMESLNSFFECLTLTKNDCFLNGKSVSRIKYYLDDDFSISFALINTAPFSALKKLDKELHHIKSSELNSLMISDSSFQITVMHHSKEWFDEESANCIAGVLDRYTDLLFVGHEHDPESIVMKSENKNMLIGNRGGSFDPSEIEKMSYYSYEIDTSSLVCKEFSYKMVVKDGHQYFEQKQTNEFSLKDIRNGDKKISREIEEKCEVIEIMHQKIRIDDLFVFPRLNGDDDDVISFDDFIKYLNKENVIQITGSSEMGKTLLSKYLFLKINEMDNYFCILVQGRDIPRENKYKTFLNNSQNEQLASDYYKQLFDNSDVSKRILIIDDFDYCKHDKNAFIKLARETYGKIVFITSYVYEKYNYKIEDTSSINQLTIGFYTKLQRDSMIENICKIREISVEDRRNIVASINSMATYSSLEELCNPFYIFLLTNNFIDQDRYQRINEKTTFSETFYLSIGKMLEVEGKKYDLDEEMLILSMLAHHLFRNKIYTFGEEELVAIKQQLKEKHSINLNVLDFLNDMLEAKMFIRTAEDEKYRFAKNSFLAFFIAARIRAKRYTDDVEFLLENIQHGIYGDVLLFLVYELSDFSIFSQIAKELKDMWNDCPRLDFYNPNNPILEKYNGGLDALFESKKNIENRLDKNENANIKELKTKEDNAFSDAEGYTEDESKIIKTMKFLEILGKAVSSFKIQIENDSRTEMIRLIKDTTFKVLYKVFEISREKMDKIEEKIAKRIENEPKLKKISFADVVNILFDTITTNSLNVITAVCNIFVSKNSISCLDNAINFSDKNDLLFKNVALERYGKTDMFTSFVKDYYLDNPESIKYMMRRVTGLFLVYHPNIKEKELNQICSIQELNKQKVLALISSKKGISKNLLETGNKKDS